MFEYGIRLGLSGDVVIVKIYSLTLSTSEVSSWTLMSQRRYYLPVWSPGVIQLISGQEYLLLWGWDNKSYNEQILKWSIMFLCRARCRLSILARCITWMF